MLTILTNNRVTASHGAQVADGDLWVPEAELQHLGLDAPHTGAAAGSATRDGRINASERWRQAQAPILCDTTKQVWALGASAAQRRTALESLQAPDFTLPDLAGNPHSLSDYRGKKVFLAAWASW